MASNIPRTAFAFASPSGRRSDVLTMGRAYGAGPSLRGAHRGR